MFAVPFLTYSSGLHRDGCSLISKKLLWFLVKTDKGIFWVVLFFVKVENIVHPFSIFGVNHLDAPHPP
jgi:hypothetical protein